MKKLQLLYFGLLLGMGTGTGRGYVTILKNYFQGTKWNDMCAYGDDSGKHRLYSDHSKQCNNHAVCAWALNHYLQVPGFAPMNGLLFYGKSSSDCYDYCINNFPGFPDRAKVQAFYALHPTLEKERQEVENLFKEILT